nr:transcription factor bHLH121-like [Arachis hypogaea]XP_025698367.1 transcription factor bHLH121-like [Arachis hypogaea]
MNMNALISKVARGWHKFDARVLFSLSLSPTAARFRFLRGITPPSFMDHWNFSKPPSLPQDSPSASPSPPPPPPPPPPPALPSNRSHREKGQAEPPQDPAVAARKVQKADREKLRRDRLNDHFHDLANTLDPDRPRNDKATILTDTIQMLKDLTAEVNRLKTEHKALSDESRELMQEKNELREEKASLKSDIENLNSQYQQRARMMFPWTAIDHSVVMAPPPYSYPVPIPIPPAPVPIHPTLQPFPYFGNQNPPHIPTPCSTYVPFSAPINAALDLPSAQYASASHVPAQKDCRSKSPPHRRITDADRCSETHDVATELELKMPGSSTQEESSSGGTKKVKHSGRKDRAVAEGSASSRYSTSHGLQDSSNSVGDIPKADS